MLMNYVELKLEIPTRMHFTDHYYIDREVWDKNLGKMKWVKSLTFWVDRVDGEPSALTFSILSTQLANLLESYLPENRYRNFEIEVTKRGSGFSTRFTVQAIPLSE